MSLTVKDVTEKLKNDFEAVPNPKGKSNVWKFFHIVKCKVTSQNVGFAQCCKCGLVLSYKEGGGNTSTMSRHIENKHNDNEDARKKPPTSAKQSFLDACVFYIGRDKASTYSLEGEGLRHLLQTAVDIAASHGAIKVIDLMPHRTTVTHHVHLEANKLREELAPTLRAAMLEGCGGAMDLWTNKFTSDHMMACSLSFVDLTFTLRVYNLMTVHFHGDETAQNIHRTLMDEMWDKYKIPEAHVKKTKMVTDGGENVVKAVNEFEEWLYCMDHALNVCVRGAMELKYHVLLGKCFQIPTVAAVLGSSDSMVQVIKNDRSKSSVQLRKLLKGPRQHNSRLSMLLSLRAHLNEVTYFLHQTGNDDMLSSVELSTLDELIEFLTPLDFDGNREKSAEVTLARLPHLLQHSNEDETDSQMTAALKRTVRHELQIMALVEQLDKCKKIVVFFKTSGCMSQLPKSLKQEIEVRWNSVLNLLESIDENWDQVATVLEADGKANKMDGMCRKTIKLLIQFYRPFKEESVKLEGEKYPTLPLAQLSYYRLRNHCNQPLTGEDGEDEPHCCTLMRVRASELLESKVKLSVTHSIGTVLFPPYRRLQRLPDAEKEAVCTPTMCLSI